MVAHRRRILALSTTLPGEPGDGTPEFVLTLAHHMAGSDVTIVAPRVRGCPTHQHVGAVRLRRFRYAPRRFERLADDAILPAIRSRPLDALQLPGLLIGLLVATQREIRAWQPDVIHAHWLLPSGLVGAMLARRSGRPLLITAHGGDAHALNGRFGRALKRWVLRRADAVHAVSDEIADALEELVPGCVTEVRPVGVDLAVLRERSGTRHPVPGQLLFVGRLVDKKGVDILLRAVALLRRPSTLTIVGDGPARPALEAQAVQLELTDRVTFRGHCGADEVAREYARAAVVVVPSKTAADGDRDGTPVVLMEALGLGVPVVATDVGGMRSLLGDRVVPENDPESLATALEDALAEPSVVAAIAEATAGRIHDTIDAAAVGRSLVRIVDLLVERRPRIQAGASA